MTSGTKTFIENTVWHPETRLFSVRIRAPEEFRNLYKDMENREVLQIYWHDTRYKTHLPKFTRPTGFYFFKVIDSYRIILKSNDPSIYNGTLAYPDLNKNWRMDVGCFFGQIDFEEITKIEYTWRIL